MRHEDSMLAERCSTCDAGSIDRLIVLSLVEAGPIEAGSIKDRSIETRQGRADEVLRMQARALSAAILMHRRSV